MIKGCRGECAAEDVSNTISATENSVVGNCHKDPVKHTLNAENRTPILFGSTSLLLRCAALRLLDDFADAVLFHQNLDCCWVLGPMETLSGVVPYVFQDGLASGVLVQVLCHIIHAQFSAGLVTEDDPGILGCTMLSNLLRCVVLLLSLDGALDLVWLTMLSLAIAP